MVSKTILSILTQDIPSWAVLAAFAVVLSGGVLKGCQLKGERDAHAERADKMERLYAKAIERAAICELINEEWERIFNAQKQRLRQIRDEQFRQIGRIREQARRDIELLRIKPTIPDTTLLTWRDLLRIDV